MLNAFKWLLIIIGGAVLVLFLIGLLTTAYQGEPVVDEVEETLKELTKKRGKRK